MKGTDIVVGAVYEVEYFGFPKARAMLGRPGWVRVEILDGPYAGKQPEIHVRQVLRPVATDSHHDG